METANNRLCRIALNAAALAFVILRCGAAELTITNQSFENPILPDNGSYGGVLGAGWTWTGIAVIHNPNNGYFTGTTDGSVGSPLHGTNAVYVNFPGKLTYRDDSWTIQPNTVFSLTFLAGYRFASPFNSSVSFWAGTNFLGKTLPTPPLGTFAAYSLNYTSPPAGPIIGLPLRIEFEPLAQDCQAWFDNVRLFTEPGVCTPHGATAVAQLVNGIFVGATITDSGCGYTNAPLVTIQGGGGSGAAATAVVTNGRVVEIQVTNGGCCYTNAPQVVIASPPFVPSVSIRVSRVMVGQRVQLGHNYVLENSFDLVTWTPTGPAFTATSEYLETEFFSDGMGRYFRLQEVP